MCIKKEMSKRQLLQMSDSSPDEEFHLLFLAGSEPLQVGVET